MKKLLLTLMVLTITIFANGQDKNKVQAMIPGYEPNVDTIELADFLKISDLVLNDNGYSILGFDFTFTHDGYETTLRCHSSKLTENIKDSIIKLKEKDIKIIKIYFEHIVVKSKDDGKNIVIGPIFYRIKI